MSSFYFYASLIFVLGLCIGSFLNVVIIRVKIGKSLIKERSFCPECKKQIKTYDLIPVFSFLFLRGACRYCRHKISWQYPLVEFFTGVFFVISYWHHFYTAGDLLWLYFFRDMIFISFLMIIFVMDLRFYLILDKITAPAMICAVLLNNFIFYLEKFSGWFALQSLFLGMLVGGGFFFLQYVLSKGRWIGGGDIRLGALMGLMLGFPNILIALFLAYVGGALISLALIAWGKKGWQSKVPFGTFLSVATIITLLYADKIIAWYLG